MLADFFGPDFGAGLVHRFAAVVDRDRNRHILEFELEKLSELLPDATWVAAGIGKAQLEVNRWCLELGGHMRTGLEDNIRLDASTLAPSNAALVEKAAQLCAEYDRHPASTAEARQILGLEPH